MFKIILNIFQKQLSLETKQDFCEVILEKIDVLDPKCSILSKKILY